MIFYTALGDSITVGKSASSPNRTYVRLVTFMLQRQSNQVHHLIFARSGWTSGSLVQAVLWNSPASLQQSTTISIWIGGNDLVRAGLITPQSRLPLVLTERLANYQRHLEILLAFIRKRSRAKIVLCTQYTPFPNTPLACETIARLNTITSNVANRYQTMLAPADTWFAGHESDLIAGYRHGRIEDAKVNFPFGPYPIHPNDKGHAVIAHHLIPYIK
ncbi:SGNH/GDSL hydrolase family protein [Effusibacillus consociatus]|uniref:SGNH/GDSL hydrolase family protein n=1 Tax=Effusibacillus consociatus TaxID=1117041 RepID=A0ABV9Q164_9BACL